MSFITSSAVRFTPAAISFSSSLRRHTMATTAKITRFDRFRVAPVRCAFLHFGTHGDKLLTKVCQLALQCVILFPCCGRIVGYHHDALLSPVFTTGPVSQQAFFGPALFSQFSVFDRINRFELIQGSRGQLLGEVGRVRRNKVDTGMLINPDEETTDWRAVCGRTACTVRRAGRGDPSRPLSD